jgi:hypothetical protein
MSYECISYFEMLNLPMFRAVARACLDTIILLQRDSGGVAASQSNGGSKPQQNDWISISVCVYV